jgi:hypothetical protein
MRKVMLAPAVIVASVLLIPNVADAQGGFRAGSSGFRGGGPGGGGAMFRPGGGFGGGFGGGLSGGGIGLRSGAFPAGIGAVSPGYRPIPGVYPRGYGINRPYYGGYYGRRYPYYRGYYRNYPYYGGYYGWGYPYYDYWGWGAAGLATGLVLGTAAASTYPVYATPAQSPDGGYCATPVRTCALINPAPLGTGCSCRTARGRARGTVVAP